jgi:putative transposase
MGTAGDACDNAMAESFFAALESEVLNRRPFKTYAEARMAISEAPRSFDLSLVR